MCVPTKMPLHVETVVFGEGIGGFDHLTNHEN